MGKYKMTESTLEDVRASKSFALVIPDHANPEPPEGGWAKVDKESKQGPWKWDEEVRIVSAEFTEGDDMDRLTFKLEFLDGPNKGRTHNETCFLRPMGDDGEFDFMTRRSFAKIDEFITQIFGEDAYIFDDDGDPDPIETAKELFKNVEARVQISQGVSYRKKKKEWGEDTEVAKVYGDDDE